MSKFIEAMRSKFGKLSKEQMDTQLLKPASGERQRMLEAACSEVLEYDSFSGQDFIKFTAYMIELLGGTLEQVEPQVTIKQSSPLDDHQNNVSILFQQKNSAQYTPFHYVTITAKNHAIAEQLEFGTQINRKRGQVTYGPVMISHVRMDKSLSFNSYLSGSMEEIFPDGIAIYQRPIDLSIEGKQFCEKVFGIYQQRGKPIT
jgi:hypothetical protein